MGSPLSKPESGTRKSFHERLNKVLKRKANQQPAPAPVPSSSSYSPPRVLSSDANRVLEPTHPPVPVPNPTPTPAPTVVSAPSIIVSIAPESPLNIREAPVVLPPLAPTPALTTREPSPAPADSLTPTPNPSTSIEPTAAFMPAPVSAPKPLVNGVWARLEASLQVLHKAALVFPPVQSAIASFMGCLDVMQESSQNHNGREEFATALANQSDIMAQHLARSNSARMSDAIANIARGIEEQLRILEGGRDRGAGWRLLEADDRERKLDSCYRGIELLFRQLQVDAELSIWRVVNDQVANSQLDRLAPVHLAKHDSTLSTSISRRTCTAATRTAILSGLDDWSYDPGQADVYWMNGMAGAGKTTIACTFSESLDRRKQLAASFFCTRTAPDCHKATRIIPTAAYQLAKYSIPFRAALCESLQSDPDAHAASIPKQFERLLKEPLCKVKEALPSNLVVVIDALDECDNMREVELLLSILLKNAAEIPVKFFMTSRPEPEIYERMKAHTRIRNVLHLHEVEKSLVEADIELYLKTELESISPTPPQIKELAKRSGVLFIYAATLVRYIISRGSRFDPRSRLESVLSMASTSAKQYAAIDDLYKTVLKAALNDELEDQEAENIRQVLRAAVCVQEPVSISVLTQLAGLASERSAMVALEPLRAVLHLSETTGLISTLHASFPDFLFDEARSGTYFCDTTLHNAQPTGRCFEVMQSELEFNICKLESSFVTDHGVEDLDERVGQAISPELWYACRYWADHLRQTSYSNSLCAELNKFLSNQLLFWMEVLNLKREMGIGVDILTKLKQWLPTHSRSGDTARHLEDCLNFVTSYAANPVAQSTPHIYISSLSFCPQSSFVFREYSNKMVGLVGVVGEITDIGELATLASWEVESGICSVAYSPDGSHVAYGCDNGILAIRGANNGRLIVPPIKAHTDAVSSLVFSPDGTRIVSCSKGRPSQLWNAMDGTLVTSSLQGYIGPTRSLAYSPDGTRIVSGCDDNTIQIRNAADGGLVAGPFKGHTDLITSVAYSPDGTRIVSGSSDRTIRVWKARDGVPISGAPDGHTGSICSVTYLPSGTRIVSSSDDGTIRVWNATNGTLVVGPLNGHTGWVWSVACSPDSARIASGSYDRTIRIWDITNGTLVAGPLEGHAEAVNSVAYSPDGTHVVSGSLDRTIRVWNATDGTLVVGPLEGHTGWVWSVTYSPDGSRIASGSLDRSIRIWDATHGTLIANLSHGHTEAVHSVAYSPDGSRIVSGSLDKTIRVWNATDGKPIVGPLEGHTESVNSVAYSPDGSRIVSGSWDMTIRVWDATEGTLFTGPLKGHAGSVNSVAYSLDGTRIVSGSSDRTIRVWKAKDGVQIPGALKGHTGSVNSIAYLHNDTRIASGSDDGTIRIWDTTDGTLVFGPLEGHTGWVWSIACSPDGARIASGSFDKTVRVWSAAEGTLVAGPLQGHTEAVNSVAYSPDGNHIVSGSLDRTIRIWDTTDGTLAVGPLEGHTGWVWSVAYSPDGTRIISGSLDRTIRVWDATDGTLVASLPRGRTEAVNPVARSPGRMVPHTLGRSIQASIAIDARSDADSPQGHTEAIHSVAYSPDGSRIVSGSLDKTIRVWNATDGTLVVGPLKGHTESVNSVAYSPDGARIVSGSWDMTIRVWDATNGTLVFGPLEGHTGSVNSVVYSPDGTRIVSGSFDKIIRFWNATDGAPINDRIQGYAHSAVSLASAPQYDNGWATTPDSTRLFWVPHDLRSFVSPDLLSQLVISPTGPLVFNFNNLLLGKRWMECFRR